MDQYDVAGGLHGRAVSTSTRSDATSKEKAVGSSKYLLMGAYRGPTRVSFGCIGV